MPKISVVIPVYNVEDCLAWCLDSLKAQTLEDFEAICVNDGSPDGSRAILSAYARDDARFVIVDKTNGGLSSARNAGMQAATSPYTCFLDADDRFVPSALARMVEVLDESGADVLTFGANAYPLDASTPWLDDVLSPRDATYEGFSTDLLFKESSRPFVWRTACRTDFLRAHGLRFDESLLYGEDQAFHFAIYSRSRKTALISDKLYDYRVSRMGSLMDGARDDQAHMLRAHVEIVRSIFEDWSSIGLDAGGVVRPVSECTASLLESNVGPMLAWVTDFVLYDSLCLDNTDWNDIAAALWDVIESLRYVVGPRDLSSIDSRLLAICEKPTCASAFARKLLAGRYYLAKRGLLCAMVAVARKLTARMRS